MTKWLKTFFLYGLLLSSVSLLGNEAPIIVGLDADMSSVAAEGGKAIKRGALLAIDEINQAGGVLGRPLKLVVKDHRGNPARGLDNILDFAQTPNLVAVLGGVHTPVALHELPAIHEHKIIYLDPWAAGTPIVDNGYQPNYVFRVSIRDEHAGGFILNEVKRRNLSKVTLVLERTGWGRSNEKSMTAAASELGISIAGIEWFNWGDRDFVKVISSLEQTQSQAFILVANAPEGAAFIKALSANKQFSNTPVFSHWGIAGGNFVERVSLEQLSKVDLNVLQTFSFVNGHRPKKSAELVNKYNEMFSTAFTPETIPSAVGVAHAYDLIHLLVSAMIKSNSSEREKVQVALENLDDYNGLVKLYSPPFTSTRHDALEPSDYQMCLYNDKGYLIPSTNP